jgi:hypothetical protein
MGSGVVSNVHFGAALIIAIAGAMLAGGNSAADSASASQKLAAIETGAARGNVSFSPGELNAWMRDEAQFRVPRGVRNLRLELGAGKATGYADIDFLKVRQSTSGEQPGWLMRNLLSGERPVVVTARFESRAGRVRVDVERVEISGIAIEGRTLDLIIDDYVRPIFPDVKVNEWVALHYGIDRFTVAPQGVTVFLNSVANLPGARPYNHCVPIDHRPERLNLSPCPAANPRSKAKCSPARSTC